MAKLTIDMDLDGYRDSYDGTLDMSRVEDDLHSAINRLPSPERLLSAQIKVYDSYGDKQVGTITLDMSKD